MLDTTKNIALIGKTLRNRTLFDIFDNKIDYDLLIKSLFDKQMNSKIIVNNFYVSHNKI